MLSCGSYRIGKWNSGRIMQLLHKYIVCAEPLAFYLKKPPTKQKGCKYEVMQVIWRINFFLQQLSINHRYNSAKPDLVKMIKKKYLISSCVCYSFNHAVGPNMVSAYIKKELWKQSLFRTKYTVPSNSSFLNPPHSINLWSALVRFWLVTNILEIGEGKGDLEVKTNQYFVLLEKAK